MKPRERRCPRCKHAIPPQTQEKSTECFPFCSKRCKLLDLGAWAKEEYSIQAEDQSETEDETNFH